GPAVKKLMEDPPLSVVERVVPTAELIVETGADQAGDVDQQVDSGAPGVLPRPVPGVYVPAGVGAYPHRGVSGRVVDGVEAHSADQVVVAPRVAQDVVAATAVQPVVAVASVEDVVVPAGPDTAAR